MPNYIFIVLSLFIIQSCSNARNEQQKFIAKTAESDTSKIETVADTLVIYSIKVKEVDSFEFKENWKKSPARDKKVLEITDANDIRDRLKGVVDFDNNSEFPNDLVVKQIHFRNGKQLDTAHDYVFWKVLAYFPEEDVLLCEGGHTADVSYNLRNGKETEETGNPRIYTYSPQNTFRLNGYFGGQECFSYFIQRKMNGEYTAIIDLDKEFERFTNSGLCQVGESFWADESTLYLIKLDMYDYGYTKQYFRIKMLEL